MGSVLDCAGKVTDISVCLNADQKCPFSPMVLTPGRRGISLDHQALPGRQFQNDLAARGHPAIGGLLVVLEMLPAVVVENDDAARRDAVEQDLERSGLGTG